MDPTCDPAPHIARRGKRRLALLGGGCGIRSAFEKAFWPETGIADVACVMQRRPKDGMLLFRYRLLSRGGAQQHGCALKRAPRAAEVPKRPQFAFTFAPFPRNMFTSRRLPMWDAWCGGYPYSSAIPELGSPLDQQLQQSPRTSRHAGCPAAGPGIWGSFRPLGVSLALSARRAGSFSIRPGGSGGVYGQKTMRGRGRGAPP